MSKSILAIAIVAALAACGGGNEANDLDNAVAITTSNTRFNANAYVREHSPSATVSVQGDATVSASCLQGSGTGLATVSDGASTVLLACPTYIAGPCVVVSQPPAGVCNANLHYPFQEL